MHHFLTEMCTPVHISVTKLFIVGCGICVTLQLLLHFVTERRNSVSLVHIQNPSSSASLSFVSCMVNAFTVMLIRFCPPLGLYLTLECKIRGFCSISSCSLCTRTIRLDLRLNVDRSYSLFHVPNIFASRFVKKFGTFLGTARSMRPEMCLSNISDEKMVTETNPGF